MARELKVPNDLLREVIAREGPLFNRTAVGKAVGVGAPTVYESLERYKRQDYAGYQDACDEYDRRRRERAEGARLAVEDSIVETLKMSITGLQVIVGAWYKNALAFYNRENPANPDGDEVRVAIALAKELGSLGGLTSETILVKLGMDDDLESLVKSFATDVPVMEGDPNEVLAAESKRLYGARDDEVVEDGMVEVQEPEPVMVEDDDWDFGDIDDE